VSSLATHSTFDASDIGALPPELLGGLTFHLPMELVALNEAGASKAIRDGRQNERLREAWAAGMVDPPLYRWAVERYRSSALALLSNEPNELTRALGDIAPLAQGLAGAAFHGLIRAGYGLWQRDANEVARGLGYMRTRRQVLSLPEPFTSPLVQATDDSCVVDVHDFPPLAECEGVTVFDLLNIAAGTQECGLTPEATTYSLAGQRMLGLQALDLLLRNPQSFVAIHAVTGFHALCEFQHAVGVLPLETWWGSYAVALRACRLIVHSAPPDALATYDDVFGPIENLDDLVAASVKSSETHDVKLAVALRRLEFLEVFTAEECVQAGIVRLASGQLFP
jgi:hypothetical protein